MPLSIPLIGEALISVSAQGDGWLEFTIDEVYVCLDGSVFPYTVARDLVD